MSWLPIAANAVRGQPRLLAARGDKKFGECETVAGIDTLGYVGVTATDMVAWRAFAPSVLGLELGEELGDGTLVYRADQYRRRLIIHPGRIDEIAYVGWECRHADDLEAVRASLRASGVAFEDASAEEAKASCVKAMVRFRDPDGLLIEAHYGPTLMSHKPFASPVGASPFVMGEQGLGHILFGTKQYRQQLEFYRNVLNFKVTDIVNLSGLGFEVTFTHVNRRHHSLALIDGLIPHCPRLHHMLLELSSLDEVGHAYQRAKDAGAHVIIDLGRHVNDNMLSFYVLTPSGWSVEIGWGGIQVDDETWHVTHYLVNSSWGHGFHPPQPAHILDTSNSVGHGEAHA